MCQDEEKNKGIDEIAMLLGEILVAAIDEGRINSQLNNKENGQRKK